MAMAHRSSLALRPLWAHGASCCAATRLKLAPFRGSLSQLCPASLAADSRRSLCISARRRAYVAGPPGDGPVPPSTPPPPLAPVQEESTATSSSGTKFFREKLLDGEEEVLTEAEKLEKDKIVKELTQRLSGPLADEHGNVPTGKDRPIAIEVDGPSHFYANSKRYTAYSKLKHRLLTRMGYKVLHVPYYEWRRLRGAKEREEYMRGKLVEEPSEWLDPEDEKYFNSPPEEGEQEFSVKAQPSPVTPSPPTPEPLRAAPRHRHGPPPTAAATPVAPSTPPPPPRHGAAAAPPRPAAPSSSAPPQRPGAPQRGGSGGAPPPPPRQRPGERPPVLTGLQDAGGRPRPPPPPPKVGGQAASAQVMGFPDFPSSK